MAKNFNKAQLWLNLLIILILLAACGGGTNEAIEDTSETDTTSVDEATESEAISDDSFGATGSEKDSGALPPTPSTDDKADPPRATPNVIANTDTAVETPPSLANRLEPELPATIHQIDVVLLIDATGSMADELNSLKGELDNIGAAFASLPDNIALNFGFVIYRDGAKDDSVQLFGLTNNWAVFAERLTAVTAVGGGDYPENLNEGFYQAVTQINWQDAADRLLILLGDAPPHLNIPGAIPYDETILLAAEQNITIFTIGGDGLNELGTAVYQQIAQIGNGRFIFVSDNPENAPTNATNAQPITSLSAILIDIVLEVLDEDIP